MPDVPMPPWMRAIQQTWLWQVVALPLLVGFWGSMLAQGCLGDKHFDQACIVSALYGTAISFLSVIISGHSVGSASFHPDGSKNETVENVVAVQKAADVIPEARPLAAKMGVESALAADTVEDIKAMK